MHGEGAVGPLSPAVHRSTGKAATHGVVETSVWSPTLKKMSTNPTDEPLTPAPVPTTTTNSIHLPDVPWPLDPSFTKAYSRQGQNQMSSAPPLQEGNEDTGTMHPDPTSSSKHSSFMAKISKKISRILPTPRTNRTRQRGRTPMAPLWCSCCVSGVEPEVVEAAPSTRHKKKVMRALKIPR